MVVAHPDTGVRWPWMTRPLPKLPPVTVQGAWQNRAGNRSPSDRVRIDVGVYGHIEVEHRAPKVELKTRRGGRHRQGHRSGPVGSHAATRVRPLLGALTALGAASPNAAASRRTDVIFVMSRLPLIRFGRCSRGSAGILASLPSRLSAGGRPRCQVAII